MAAAIAIPACAQHVAAYSRHAPINVPVNPDARTYTLALLLAIFSGLFFGLIPVRQMLRIDPWQIIRSGAANVTNSRAASLCVTSC